MTIQKTLSDNELTVALSGRLDTLADTLLTLKERERDLIIQHTTRDTP